MVAYLEINRYSYHRVYALVICNNPCNGIEYINAERQVVSGKREANKICKERGLKPWNF